ncbi:MAG: hypothetical protein VKK04_20440 [Synechococcales bacterium]|nr:hypothetical protein [Synechococcales bacterium]
MNPSSLPPAVKHRVKEVLAYPHLLTYRPDQVNRFVIFGQGRSGSQLLCDLIGSHPQVHCDLEILSQKVAFPIAYINSLCARSGAPTYGFKVKIYQLVEDQHLDPQQFLQTLHQRNWKIIYLTRTNVLRQSLSSLVGAIKNQWHIRSSSAADRSKVHIDCDRLLAELNSRQRYSQQEETILSTLPHIKVVYEEDLLIQEHHQPTLDRIFAYLGVESVPAKSKLKRTSSDRIADIIQNYDELVNTLQGTPFAEFLVS